MQRGRRDDTRLRPGSCRAVRCCSSRCRWRSTRFTEHEIVGHQVTPELLSFTPQQLALLKLPSGFTASIFASGLGKPRTLAVADDGRVYVTRREPGDVVVLRDANNDGRSDEMRIAVRRPMLHGIAIDRRWVYLVGVKDVFTADVTDEGPFANITRIVDDLPEAGQHADRTIWVGLDKYLYVSVGSTCNSCNETSPENATILRDGRPRARAR